MNRSHRREVWNWELNRSHRREEWNWGLIAALTACLLFWMSIAGATIWVVRSASGEPIASQQTVDLAGQMSISVEMAGATHTSS